MLSTVDSLTVYVVNSREVVSDEPEESTSSQTKPANPDDSKNNSSDSSSTGEKDDENSENEGQDSTNDPNKDEENNPDEKLPDIIFGE